MSSGLMLAMATAFDERGEVDLRAAEAVVERIIAGRVPLMIGVGAAGGTKEAIDSPRRERRGGRRLRRLTVLLEGRRGGVVRTLRNRCGVRMAKGLG